MSKNVYMSQCEIKNQGIAKLQSQPTNDETCITSLNLRMGVIKDLNSKYSKLIQIAKMPAVLQIF